MEILYCHFGTTLFHAASRFHTGLRFSERGNSGWGGDGASVCGLFSKGRVVLEAGRGQMFSIWEIGVV